VKWANISFFPFKVEHALSKNETKTIT